MPTYLPVCPPVIYSENKNIKNYTTNNPSSLGTKPLIYSNILQYPKGKKMYYANLSLDAFGTVQAYAVQTKPKNTFG
jgi:hypothetical protein